MIGQSFGSFFVLLIISLVVAAILHYGFRYYARPGGWSFVSKTVLGWIGAWLGSPVFGHWWSGLSYEEVYYVPAILGSFALIVFVVDFVKSAAGAGGRGAAGGGREAF